MFGEKSRFSLLLPPMLSKALGKKAVCKNTPCIRIQRTQGSNQEVAGLVREDCCKLAGS